MQSSPKQEFFSEFVFAFWQSILNFGHFPKLRTPKNVVRYMSKKSCFRGPFDKQHAKRAQTLL